MSMYIIHKYKIDRGTNPSQLALAGNLAPKRSKVGGDGAEHDTHQQFGQRLSGLDNYK